MVLAGVIVSVVVSSAGSNPGRVTTTFTVSGPSETLVTVGGVEPVEVQPPAPLGTKYSTVSVGLVPVRLVVCEFSTPPWKPFNLAYGIYLRQVLPRVARLVSSNTPAYGYLAESIADWPDQRDLARVIEGAGWERVGFHNLTGGIVALHRAFAPR